MSGWQPIETAPKDGTEFQSWETHFQSAPISSGWWEPRARINPETGLYECHGRVDYDQDGWESCLEITATHWMPQPTCPVQS